MVLHVPRHPAAQPRRCLSRGTARAEQCLKPQGTTAHSEALLLLPPPPLLLLLLLPPPLPLPLPPPPAAAAAAAACLPGVLAVWC